MQVSSINFCSGYKIAGKNQRKVHYTNYRPEKNTSAKCQKALISTGASLGTVLFLLTNPFGIAETTLPIEDGDIFIPSTSITEEGEMPSIEFFDDNFSTTSPILDYNEFIDDESNIEIETSEIEEETIETEAPKRAFEINLSEEQKMSLSNFILNWEENIDRYENMEEETGVPAELIAAIHWRESNGDFNTYLHNGSQLGQTIDTYFGERWFDNWEEAAKDALNSAIKVSFDEENLETYYRFAEMYNGTGYSDYFNMNSPYVWAGTDKYVCGKYTSDGVFNPDVIDRQVGVAVLLDSILS